MLASLLHQILKQLPETIPKLLNEMKECGDKRLPEHWLENSPRSALCTAVYLSHSTMYLFIDGLDEVENSYSEGYHDIKDMLELLCQKPRVKTCVSSRPHPIFERAFKVYPNLQLQDLTYDDLKYIIKSKLENQFTNSEAQPQDLQIFQPLVGLILNKAEGVFLWVVLVVSNISSGLDDYDDAASILSRVETLPEGLTSLYRHMRDRSNKGADGLRNKGARFLKTLLFQQLVHSIDLRDQSSTLHHFVVMDTSIQQEYLGAGTYATEQRLLKRCVGFRKQLLARCAGLVEADKIEDDSIDCLLHARVRFIQKTP